MPNPENIVNHKFEKGKSGNLKGRPLGKSVSTILKELLDGKIQGANGEKKTRSMVIALKLFEKAIKFGDMRAIQEILDRTEGKALQKTEVNANISQIEMHPAISKTDSIHELNKIIEAGSIMLDSPSED